MMGVMTIDLAAFLNARLDEDEHWAHMTSPGWPSEVTFILRYDPARVFREVEAGRAILARYADCLLRMEDPDYPAAVARDQAREYEDFVLPNLAAVYSGHPDYNPEWA
jgi:hypothetical protein